MVVAQRDAKRLLEPDRGGERERPPARQRLLERRDADLGLVGQQLARDAAARQLLADLRRDQPALVVAELGLGTDVHRFPLSIFQQLLPEPIRDGLRFPAENALKLSSTHKSSHIRTGPDSARRNATAHCRTSPN